MINYYIQSAYKSHIMMNKIAFNFHCFNGFGYSTVIDTTKDNLQMKKLERVDY